MNLSVTEKSPGQWEAALREHNTFVGHGSNAKEAIGDFMINNSEQLLGIDIEIEPFRDPNQFELPVHAG